jgi:hypothetical protein
VTKTTGTLVAVRPRLRKPRISRRRESCVHSAPAEPPGRESEASRRSWRWPPPISATHAALRERIARGLAALEGHIPDGTDLEGAIYENPELANYAAQLVGLMREERDFLSAKGEDPRPWRW